MGTLYGVRRRDQWFGDSTYEITGLGTPVTVAYDPGGVRFYDEDGTPVYSVDRGSWGLEFGVSDAAGRRVATVEDDVAFLGRRWRVDDGTAVVHLRTAGAVGALLDVLDAGPVDLPDRYAVLADGERVGTAAWRGDRCRVELDAALPVDPGLVLVTAVLIDIEEQDERHHAAVRESGGLGDDLLDAVFR